MPDFDQIVVVKAQTAEEARDNLGLSDDWPFKMIAPGTWCAPCSELMFPLPLAKTAYGRMIRN